jgi:HPt (histidine-containing phosphotransfer) domain-containing protein
MLMQLGESLTWKTQALGIATLNADSRGGLAIQHVALNIEGATLTGSWLLDGAELASTQPLITHWIPVGDAEGLKVAANVLGGELPSASLAELVAMCRSAESEIRQQWDSHQAEDPKKREKLVPIRQVAWPEIDGHEQPARALETIGVTPHPTSTPREMQTPLALARLVQYIGNCWAELETQRTSRKYLRSSSLPREILPGEWLQKNPPWWPKN